MIDKSIFSSVKKESAVDFIINTFKRLLIEKKMVPGDRLPSETELAENLNVSRGSIREAMKILSAFGIVEIKRGDGTYIANSSNKSIFDPFLFNLIISDANNQELVELRESMEEQVIKLILKNAKDKDLEMIEETYLDMKRAIENGVSDPKILTEHDLEFHARLGSATKNILFEKIYEFILELFSHSIEGTHYYPQNGTAALNLHWQIIESLKERNLDKALKSLEKSIREWKNFFKNGN